MDAVMQVLTQIVLMVVLIGYFAFVAALGAVIIWFTYHRWHDHWTVAQAWQQARSRLFH